MNDLTNKDEKEVREMEKELKQSINKTKEENVIRLLKREFSDGITKKQIEEIEKLKGKFTEQQILKALRIARSVNKVTLSYIKAVLRGF
ncbi:DnaD domain protein [Bacteroidales bacterium MSK.15.36]|nr:DnaD domain protein [Bacteroidales bacterium MSK.15.36]